jgi:hypothetical protein
MYVTDFGQWGRVPVEPQWLASLGLSRLLVADLDLAAELALADVLTGTPPASATIAIVSVLNTFFDTLGYLPSPTLRENERVQAYDAHAYVQFHSYHTTFVYGLLCAVIGALGEVRPFFGKAFESLPAAGLPAEWHGQRRGLALINEQVGHTYETWARLAAERGMDLGTHGGALLRGVVDAYLVETVQSGRVDDAASLIRMARVVGESPIDRAARSLMSTRVRLGGITEVPAWLEAPQ